MFFKCDGAGGDMALKRGGRTKGKSRIPGVCEFHGVKISEGVRDGET